MLLPPQYQWFEPILIAAIIVFVVNLMGSMLVHFSMRSPQHSYSR
jgi:hypothetical protein